jgi:hypothetical protein
MAEASDVAAILVVRSVEEAAPELLGADAGVDAARAAGPLHEEPRWLARRAERLLRELPPGYRSLPAMSGVLAGRVAPVAGIAAVAGMLTNYLGPSQRIHAVYNPVVLLILWNLGVYALLLAGRLRRGTGSAQSGSAPLRPSTSKGPADAATGDGEQERRASGSPGARPGIPMRWIFRHLVPALWLRLHRGSGEVRDEAKRLRRVVRRFCTLWIGVAQPLLALHTRRLLSWAALGLAAGAVLGMFVRGLFLDYHIVWRSTFVKEVRELIEARLTPLLPQLSEQIWTRVKPMLAEPPGAPR